MLNIICGHEFKWNDSIKTRNYFSFIKTFANVWQDDISSISSRSNLDAVKLHEILIIISHAYTKKFHKNPLLTQMHSLFGSQLVTTSWSQELTFFLKPKNCNSFYFFWFLHNHNVTINQVLGKTHKFVIHIVCVRT
jgi:hypothetical protein